MKIFFLLLFWSLWFVNFSSRTIISPLLPIIEDQLGLSHAMAGSVVSFLSIGYTITLLLSGVLSPRIGYKRSIVLGFSILVISLFFLNRASTYVSFAAATLSIGLGAGIYLPSAIPLITTVFGRDTWGKVFGFHETAACFSIFSIPLFAAIALRYLDWRVLFLILSGACSLIGIFFYVFSPDPRPHRETGVKLSSLLYRKDFWIMAILWTVGTSNGLGLYTIIPLFLVKENGIGLEAANTIFGFSRAGGLVSIFLAGLLADRYGVKKILFLILLLSGLSSMGLALARTAPFLLGALILQGTLYTGFFSVGLVAISKLTDFNERSVFTGGVAALGMVCGMGLTPVILGALADLWTFRIGIFLLGLATILSCISLKGISRDT